MNIHSGALIRYSAHQSPRPATLTVNFVKIQVKNTIGVEQKQVIILLCLYDISSEEVRTWEQNFAFNTSYLRVEGKFDF